MIKLLAKDGQMEVRLEGDLGEIKTELGAAITILIGDVYKAVGEELGKDEAIKFIEEVFDDNPIVLGREGEAKTGGPYAS